jgi:two-component system nitrogen regulation response regulator NtrX
VRELANIVERLVILHAGQHVGAPQVQEVLPTSVELRGERMRSVPVASDSPDTDLPLADALDAYERFLIVNALTAASGNVAEAARRLQTDRPNLYRRMRRLGIVSDSGVTHPA